MIAASGSLKLILDCTHTFADASGSGVGNRTAEQHGGRTQLDTLPETEVLAAPSSASRRSSLNVKFTMHSSDDSERLRALKTGYLIKRPSIRKHGNKMKFWAGGKQKFFVLRGGSLTYHKDHRTVDDAAHSKEVLLTADCDVDDFYDPPDANFGFCISSKGKVLQLVAKDVLERQEWKDAICMVINQVRELSTEHHMSLLLRVLARAAAVVQLERTTASANALSLPAVYAWPTQVKCTTRGYLLKRCAGAPYSSAQAAAAAGTNTNSSGGSISMYSSSSSGASQLQVDEDALWTRRFFIMSGTEKRLTFHADHSLARCEVKMPPIKASAMLTCNTRVCAYLLCLVTHTANNSHALVVQGSFALSADTTIEKKPHNVVALKDGSSCMVSHASQFTACVMEYTLRRCTSTVVPSIAVLLMLLLVVLAVRSNTAAAMQTMQHAQPAMVTQLIQLLLLRHLLLLSPSLQIFRADDAQECQRWVAAVSGVITEAKRACVQQRAAAAAAAAAAANNNSLNASAANGISGGSPAQISRAIELCMLLVLSEVYACTHADAKCSSSELTALETTLHTALGASTVYIYNGFLTAAAAVCCTVLCYAKQRSDTEELLAQVQAATTLNSSSSSSSCITPYPTPQGETERARGYLLTRAVTEHATSAASSVQGRVTADLTEGGIGSGLNSASSVAGESWLPNYYLLTNAALYRCSISLCCCCCCYCRHTRRLEDEHFVAPAARLALTPSCSVFATNLRPHSFELVTANRVLHVQGISHDSASTWISNLKAAINAVSVTVHSSSNVSVAAVAMSNIRSSSD
eukprot:14925-Heterococcus_DN1.PRE.2